MSNSRLESLKHIPNISPRQKSSVFDFEFGAQVFEIESPARAIVVCLFCFFSSNQTFDGSKRRELIEQSCLFNQTNKRTMRKMWVSSFTISAHYFLLVLLFPAGHLAASVAKSSSRRGGIFPIFLNQFSFSLKKQKNPRCLLLIPSSKLLTGRRF